jgi:hypothetical protein
MLMKKSSSFTLLVCGVVLAIVGFSGTNALRTDLAHFFSTSGSSTDNAIGMLMGGSIAALAGLVLTLCHWKQA